MSGATAEHPATLLIESADRLMAYRLVGDTTIGRDRKCSIVLNHPTVSRSHARLYRDATGWHVQDLGSQNGSRLSDSKTTNGGVLREGAELRIGRVRAWFFSGAVPSGWVPPEASRLAGKLIRCSCGHIGWAPMKSGDGHLRCSACGREIVRRDPNSESRVPNSKSRVAAAVASAPTVVADCAACHTSIQSDESMQTCPDCNSTMHAGCWEENRGCATYGCPQVGVLDHADEVAPLKASTNVVATKDEADRASHSSGGTFGNAAKQSLVAVAAFAVAGLPAFGVPAIGYAVYRVMYADLAQEGRRRFVWAMLSFVAGIVGIVSSSMWWLGYRG